MRNIQRLERWLASAASEGRSSLYQTQDFRSLFPELSENAYRALIHRAQKTGVLEKICQGIYQNRNHPDTSGRLLFRTAALLRAQHFNYISLESALSDAGVISQIPMNWVTIISTGRTATVNCSRFGAIEFIRTERDLNEIADQLTYDEECHLFRASASLALSDMVRYHREGTGDLIQQATEERT